MVRLRAFHAEVGTCLCVPTRTAGLPRRTHARTSDATALASPASAREVKACLPCQYAPFKHLPGAALVQCPAVVAACTLTE